MRRLAIILAAAGALAGCGSGSNAYVNQAATAMVRDGTTRTAARCLAQHLPRWIDAAIANPQAHRAALQRLASENTSDTSDGPEVDKAENACGSTMFNGMSTSP